MSCRRDEIAGGWSVCYAPDGDLNQGMVLLASIQTVAGDVQFRWTAALDDEPLQRQLANCLLRVRSGAQTQSVQLRRPQSLAALSIDLDAKESKLEFRVDDPPQAANLLLEIKTPPRGGRFVDGAASAAVARPIVVQFAELRGAELSLRLQKLAGAGQLAVRSEAEFVEGPRLKYELTRPKLEEMSKRWREMSQKAAVTIKQTQSRITALQSQLGDVSSVSGDLSVMAERTRQMKAIQERLKIEMERLPTHRKRLAEAEARLQAVPTVEKFLDQHDQTAVAFRIIAQAGSDQIVLAESAR
jgi:hypothetical protein